jgi:arginase family enzyme
MLKEEGVAFFGFDPESGWIDPPELEALQRSGMWKYPQARVRADPVAAASDALQHLERWSGVILVHFDVDVMDFPAVDVPHHDGLDAQSAFAALNVFVKAPTCAAVVITELNPERDQDGSYTAALVKGLVEAIGA